MAFGLCLSINTQAQPVAFTRVDSFSWSEPVTLNAAFRDWQGDFLGGNQQFSDNWLETGVRVNDWTLAFLYRYDIALRFSQDTADFYYRSQNDLSIDPDRRYHLSLNGLRFTARGLRFSKMHQPVHSLSLTWGLSLFEADQRIDGEINGTDRSARIDYFYSKDELFDRVVDRPSGTGISLDLAFKTHVFTDTRITAHVTDLLGTILWQDAPRTQASASLDRTSSNQDGVVTLEPLISGRETIKSNDWQILQPRVHIQVHQPLNPRIDALFDYRYQHGKHLISTGAAFNNQEQKFGLRLWPQIDTLELFFQHPHWQISVASDALSKTQAQTLWLRFSLN